MTAAQPVRIAFLADHPEHVDTLARWHYEQWRTFIPEWSFEDARRELASHTARVAIPTTLVALADDEVIGSASLVVEDLPEWRRFSPWVASVFVAPGWRGRGVATRLVDRATRVAADAGTTTLYLLTEDKADFYRRRGWTDVAVPPYPARPVTILRRATGTR